MKNAICRFKVKEILRAVVVGGVFLAGLVNLVSAVETTQVKQEYAKVQKRLAKGWNTFSTHSVLWHVRMPEALAVKLGFSRDGQHLTEALIGREDIKPGPRAWDSSYTQMTLRWNGFDIMVQSGVDGDDLVLLVTPQLGNAPGGKVTVDAVMLWDRKANSIAREGETLKACLPDLTATVYCTGVPDAEPAKGAPASSLALPLDGALGFATGKKRTVEQIQKILEKKKAALDSRAKKFGKLAETYNAIQTVLAWDTIFEPSKNRVVATVSRVWNVDDLWKGWVLFDWDTYFASYLASIDNKDLAYACAYEITHEITPEGFIPNYAAGRGSSFDRSQPPVGSMIIRELYRHFGDKWFLEANFDELLSWNRWWEKQRQIKGYLAWGSNVWPEGRLGRINSHSWQASAYESGLDNSPMYDDVPFNKEANVLELADVGLMSMYVMDCDALAEIAGVLHRKAEAEELKTRGEKWRKQLATLWNDEAGIFLNRRTDTGEFSHRLSPTLFYPMLGRAATQAQAERMVKEHLQNEKEFGGQWVLPSAPYNDPAFAQDYWRGPVWAPMNFLVYLGLCNYKLPEAKKELADKSRELILKEWRTMGHVHENYSSVNGEGCCNKRSDKFYHWGALLGVISFIEEGVLPAPDKKLR